MNAMISRPVPLLGVLLLTASCDMDRAAGPEDGGIALAAVFPSVVGTYAGTANVVATTTFGLRETVSCPIQVSVLSQTDSAFAGGFTLLGGDCGTEPGTLQGIVSDTGAVRVLADAEGGGANIFEDASARSGCALVSSSGTLNGKVADTLLNVLGTAAFDCPSSFGTIRVNASANVTANRIQQVTAQLLRE